MKNSCLKERGTINPFFTKSKGCWSKSIYFQKILDSLKVHRFISAPYIFTIKSLFFTCPLNFFSMVDLFSMKFSSFCCSRIVSYFKSWLINIMRIYMCALYILVLFSPTYCTLWIKYHELMLILVLTNLDLFMFFARILQNWKILDMSRMLSCGSSRRKFISLQQVFIKILRFGYTCKRVSGLLYLFYCYSTHESLLSET